MRSHFLEVTNGFNWGKFQLLQYDQEWTMPSALPEAKGHGLLWGRGLGPDHFWMLDLETGEGGMFRHGGSAKADLNKHMIWVCPMFEPTLTWLYQQDLTNITTLPNLVKLAQSEAPSSMFGYRREGK